jgi:hypothetical protein
MVTEMLVALMALIAACALQPGEYFAINAGHQQDDVARASHGGHLPSKAFPVTVAGMDKLAADIGEKTMFGRVGGAPTFAVGMAQMFARAFGPVWMAFWYHFAIMFEALFILTTIDAGTRVGRFILQDFLGGIWKPLGNTRSLPANVFASALLVAGWGFSSIKASSIPWAASTRCGRSLASRTSCSPSSPSASAPPSSSRWAKPATCRHRHPAALPHERHLQRRATSSSSMPIPRWASSPPAKFYADKIAAGRHADRNEGVGGAEASTSPWIRLSPPSSWPPSPSSSSAACASGSNCSAARRRSY